MPVVLVLAHIAQHYERLDAPSLCYRQYNAADLQSLRQPGPDKTTILLCLTSQEDSRTGKIKLDLNAST